MTTSEELHARASRVLPGGATAAARINKVLGRPLYMARAEGSRLFDSEGRAYIDMCTSMGASLLGHGHPAVRAALRQAGDLGVMCSAESIYQIELAEKIAAAVPCAEMVRFTLSGTETTWYAVRLARTVTGRRMVVKFEGHFHGYNDYLQYNYWPPAGQTWPNIYPEAPGLPGAESFVIVLPFNDATLLEQTLSERRDEIACVILEPVNFNSGGMTPLPGYLQTLRRLTEQYGIILIFDEILSGFRTGAGCMQAHLGVTPDLCTLGKALGGGVPLSAFAGKRSVMSNIAPAGRAMHSGTYNANLVNILPGLAFMNEIAQPGFYPGLLARCARLYAGMNAAFARAGVAARVQATGARFNILFGEASRRPLVSYADALHQDGDMALRFYKACLPRGVYFHPAWHHGISAAHSDADIDEVIAATQAAAQEL